MNTKFIARRSDIIVSSTLSITLTPMDEDFTPAPFAKIDADEIWDYVMKRQEYRAFSVVSNSIQKQVNAQHNMENGLISESESISVSGMDYSMSAFD